MAYQQQYTGWIPLPNYGYNTTASYSTTYNDSHNASYNTGYTGYAGGWSAPAPPQPSYKPATTTHTFEVETDQQSTIQQPKKSFFTGLRNTLRLWLIGAIVVFLVNIIWLIYAKAKYGIANGYGTIQSGDCAAVKRTNVWLHLLINVLSTLLLTGSNAFMAAYSSPTRKEVDKAHARKVWLHIGFASLRNLRGIAWRKSLVVILLILSSVPFHFFYNSLVYESLASAEYYWFIATEDFVSGASFQLDGNEEDDFQPYVSDVQRNASQWERLDQKACIKAYSSAFVNDRRNVVLVTSNQNDTTSLIQYAEAQFDAGDLTNNWWICSLLDGNDGGNLHCNPEIDISDPASWEVKGNPIEYCLSERIDSKCTVRFSMDIMIIVISCNAVKLLVMAWVFFRFDAEHLLASVGDAASSFIQQPDPTTRGICLASRRQINNFWGMPGVSALYAGRRRYHWGQAITKKRWILFFMLCGFALGTIFIFSILGFSWIRDRGIALNASSLWRLGFGTVDASTMVFYGGLGNALTMSLFANVPQIFLAAIYLMYMGIMTSMFCAADWARFAAAPQSLMVSSPRGKQRGTWLLGAPLKYGIPLLVLQVLLHWFVSQGLFMVQIQAYDVSGQIDHASPLYSNCGYSPIAIIATVITCCLLVLLAIVFMFFRFPMGSPPVVSSCSAAISASCHVPPHLMTEDMVLGDLRWGVSEHVVGGIGHCSLAPAHCWTTGRVGPPADGWAYAGMIAHRQPSEQEKKAT